jgi:hypothetical protein
MYWHIGETAIRFRSVTSFNEKESNRLGILGFGFLNGYCNKNKADSLSLLFGVSKLAIALAMDSIRRITQKQVEISLISNHRSSGSSRL